MEQTPVSDCIFCKISKGEMPCYKVWENADFLAFLSIFPEIEGMTIVIPKKHYDSYIFEQGREVINNLMSACGDVAKILDSKLGCTRTKLVFEGLEVSHLHAKLYPMYLGVEENRHTKKAGEKELNDVLNKILQT